MNSRSIYGIPAGRLLIIGGSLLTIIFSAVLTFLSGEGFTWLWLVAPSLIIALTALLSLDKFLLLTLFLVPLSVQLRFLFPEVTADLFLPTEPMLAVIMLIMIFKAFASGEIDKRILFHPVTRITGIFLLWLLIASLTGTMPLVSLKYLITRIWFITAFFLLAARLFYDRNMIRSYFTAYLLGMTPVAIYYLVRLSQYGVLKQVSAYSAIRPFFNDHTALGASLAFCIPAVIYLISLKENRFIRKLFLFLQLVLFSVAFIYSYSRAAWLSLAAAAIVSMLLLLRVSWKVILPLLLASLIALILGWSSLMIRLGENRQNSSLEIDKQLQSIVNIRTDASNLERINRWRSALRMSSERPMLGWGPGTYQFNYAPFQMAGEKTAISTNWGEAGNAHSEYLGLLAESGIPGMSIYIILLFIIMRRGIIRFKQTNERGERILLLCMLAGLVTYITHGLLNNFLDTDKISALFWGMAAVIVALDLGSGHEEKESNKDPQQ